MYRNVFLKKKSQGNPITLKNSQDQNPKSSANSDYHAAGQPTCHNSGIVYQCSRIATEVLELCEEVRESGIMR